MEKPVKKEVISRIDGGVIDSRVKYNQGHQEMADWVVGELEDLYEMSGVDDAQLAHNLILGLDQLIKRIKG